MFKKNLMYFIFIYFVFMLQYELLQLTYILLISGNVKQFF